jgi:hypothetical protein
VAGGLVYDGGVNASASEEILAYHRSTKHSPGSVRASRWFMDWSNTQSMMGDVGVGRAA